MLLAAQEATQATNPSISGSESSQPPSALKRDYEGNIKIWNVRRE